MANEILSEIRNKLTAPKIALERLAKGEKVPGEFLELAAEELKAAVSTLFDIFSNVASSIFKVSNIRKLNQQSISLLQEER